MQRSNRRWQTVGKLTMVSIAGGIALAACSSPPAASGPSSTGTKGAAVLSPTKARSLVATTMTTNNKSNDELDSRLLSSYEAGSAFVLDDATYRAELLAKKEASYHPAESPFTLKLRGLAVTHQTTWPAQFVAAGPVVALQKNAPKSPSCGSLLDFEKLSPSGRWRIVLEPTTNAKDIPALATDSSGYAERVPVATERAADAIPKRLANALITEETSGKLGPFTKADFTGSCWQLPDPREDLIDGEAAGYSARDLYSVVSPSDTAAFALTGGKTLVMFTIKFDDQLIADSASDPVEWSRASLSKNPGAVWTYFLSAGAYSEIKEQGELEVAVLLSANLKSYSVVGSYSGITAVSGNKVKQSSPPPTGTLTGWSEYTNR